MSTKGKTTTEPEESKHLVRSGFQLARTLGISTLVVQADELRDVRMVEKAREEERVVWLTRREKGPPLREERKDVAIRLPEASLSRMSQLEFGLLHALANRLVEPDESVVCMTGAAGSERLDTLLIAKPRRNFPWFGRRRPETDSEALNSPVFMRILEVAVRLATEGREGRRVGTIFVLVDEEQADPHVRQLVLNPLAGHPQRDRNIHDRQFFETVRELASLDGAFLVSRRGVVQSAGTYLDAPTRKAKLGRGLGSRHAAALAITAATEAVAVAVSQSSRIVTVFHAGRMILELECPEARSAD